MMKCMLQPCSCQLHSSCHPCSFCQPRSRQLCASQLLPKVSCNVPAPTITECALTTPPACNAASMRIRIMCDASCKAFKTCSPTASTMLPRGWSSCCLAAHSITETDPQGAAAPAQGIRTIAMRSMYRCGPSKTSTRALPAKLPWSMQSSASISVSNAMMAHFMHDRLCALWTNVGHDHGIDLVGVTRNV